MAKAITVVDEAPPRAYAHRPAKAAAYLEALPKLAADSHRCGQA